MSSAWYAVYTGMRAEQRASGSIGQLGIKTFCPMYEKIISHANRRKRVERPLLSRYLFAQFDAWTDPWGLILQADGVESILCSCRHDGQDIILNPVAVPDRQMAKIMAWKEHPEIIAAARVGDVMRIIGGPFIGFQTKLVEVCPDRYRARGEVDMFGRKTVTEFDLEQLDQD